MLRAVKYKFHEKGFSLFEILIAIAVFATMGLAAAQLISVSLQADKAGGQKTVGAKLVSEEMEAVNAIATEQWNILCRCLVGKMGDLHRKRAHHRQRS
ncbi:MAG: hypothetical protein UW81_C0042G0007 [Candidatus Giovannonibacteria bacterium GW2011_GWC2_44_9]|uniref:Uncharacterized protein n=1 Tax=Candidatus Giovannonibacteria bacterium GW2011_GWC2_44_9 TaxID=1618658 RepID=A0A0G1KF78_9BACT|nr:MAG: hypothetical protein UW81_C0042G0007 [Candidatus Giovannonibacteria bacterium GW2011_GWC2_44_9]